MNAKRQLFVSCNARGLELGAEQIGLGLPLILGFTLLPQQSPATALPTRYNIASGTESTRWYGRQAAWLDKEALSLSPVFRLSRNCSNGVAAVPQQLATAEAAAPTGLQQMRSITSHPIQTSLADLSDSSSSSTTTTQAAVTTAAAPAAAAVAEVPTSSTKRIRQHLQRQYNTSAGSDNNSSEGLPWLGAKLDIAGYTKKGYMRGGGKEQNQDRGLIMQHFRSPNEMLLGVMDGHGVFGHLVSSYIIQHLPAVLMQKIVDAAATLTGSSSGGSSSHGKEHRKHDHHKGQKGAEQQQQQQLQYVVIPDHGSDGGSSNFALDLHEQQQQQQNVKGGNAHHRRGRLISRHRVVHQPDHIAQQDGSSSSSGSSSSRDAATNQQIISSSILNDVTISKGLLSATFAETDHMLSCSGINVLDSGSTALVTHISDSKITTAWVGDSRAVLGRRLVDADQGLRSPKQQQHFWQQWGDDSSSSSNGDGGGSSSSSQKWQVIQLSDDHKPERPDEQIRIVMNGGRVEQMKDSSGRGIGPHRVWFKQIDYPGLAMSRAFGDAPCRRIGVTCEPQLYVHRLTDADQILVAATDGVWEYMSNQEAIELVGKCSNAATAARQLVEMAEQRWQQVEKGNYIDDITAVVVMATPRPNSISSKL